MKKRSVYLLAGFLTFSGPTLATYKIAVLDFPLIPGARTSLWTVEAQFDFLSDRLTNLEKTRDVFVDIPSTFDFQYLESFLGVFDRLGHRGLDRHYANGHGCTDAAAIATEQLVERLTFSKALRYRKSSERFVVERVGNSAIGAREGILFLKIRMVLSGECIMRSRLMRRLSGHSFQDV